MEENTDHKDRADRTDPDSAQTVRGNAAGAKTRDGQIIKAIVMDMDGTLLDENNKIRPAVRDMLIALEEHGVRLVLASGRSYTRLLGYARELKMDEHEGMLIEIDGVALYDLGANKRTKFRMMEPDEIHNVYNWLIAHNAEAQAMFDDGLFYAFDSEILEIKKKLRRELNLPEDFPWTAGPWNWLTDFRDGYPKMKYVQSADEINRPINKIQIMQDEEPLEQVYQGLQKAFGDDFAIYRTTPRQLEILPAGFSKGEALRRMMEQEDWKKDEVLVFGDGENDVSMFGVVRDSYAMGNAKDFVKAQAAHTAPSNCEEGIACALRDLFGSLERNR